MDRKTSGNDWDRSGLPGWAYTSPALFEAERDAVFRRHWQLVGHAGDIPEPGDFVTLDVMGERALVVRGHDREIRAFHNLCRHRGTRVVSASQGRCNKAIICPFHGWAYNLDGTLRGIAERGSFPDLDKVEWGLKPLDCEVWHGFVFVRFAASDQPPVAELLARYESYFTAHQTAGMVHAEGSRWSEEVAANWKAVRDVDNEGYHVRQAHPALHDLYGADYVDDPYEGGASRSVGRFNPGPSKLWSVTNYRKIVGAATRLEAPHDAEWVYIGLFPNTVIGLYPDSAIWYQEVPLGPERTLQRGAAYRYADEDRALRAARYLSGRIDRDTMAEDHMLCVWAAEATRSSAYSGVMLSDLEYGLKTFHDHLRAVVPALCQPVEPEAEGFKSAGRGMTGNEG